jgi:hypothetical protein
MSVCVDTQTEGSDAPQSFCWGHALAEGPFYDLEKERPSVTETGVGTSSGAWDAHVHGGQRLYEEERLQVVRQQG